MNENSLYKVLQLHRHEHYPSENCTILFSGTLTDKIIGDFDSYVVKTI
jgi:hypothetical protein